MTDNQISKRELNLDTRGGRHADTGVTRDRVCDTSWQSLAISRDEQVKMRVQASHATECATPRANHTPSAEHSSQMADEKKKEDESTGVTHPVLR